MVIIVLTAIWLDFTQFQGDSYQVLYAKHHTAYLPARGFEVASGPEY